MNDARVFSPPENIREQEFPDVFFCAPRSIRTTSNNYLYLTHPDLTGINLNRGSTSEGRTFGARGGTVLPQADRAYALAYIAAKKDYPYAPRAIRKRRARAVRITERIKKLLLMKKQKT